MNTDELGFHVSDRYGDVSALLTRPRGATFLYVLAHGAGAGMHHPFMAAIAERLYERRVATFRYQFPYMESGRKRPDHRVVCEQTVSAAVTYAAKAVPRLPFIAGGKSMGGRMTSHVAAAGELQRVRGLAFLGFPLHPPKKPGTSRADHLADVSLPMLFLQGTRDALANLELMRPLCEELGRRATLHVVDGADHGFHVLKRSGRTDDEVLDELATELAAWGEKVVS